MYLFLYFRKMSDDGDSVIDESPKRGLVIKTGESKEELKLPKFHNKSPKVAHGAPPSPINLSGSVKQAETHNILHAFRFTGASHPSSPTNAKV